METTVKVAGILTMGALRVVAAQKFQEKKRFLRRTDFKTNRHTPPHNTLIACLGKLQCWSSSIYLKWILFRFADYTKECNVINLI